MTKKHSRYIAPIAITALVVALSAGMIFLYFWIRSVGGLALIIPIVLSIFYIPTIIGVIIALISRIKEIKGGEEDEASKY